jgi:hypothetical protein
MQLQHSKLHSGIASEIVHLLLQLLLWLGLILLFWLWLGTENALTQTGKKVAREVVASNNELAQGFSPRGFMSSGGMGQTDPLDKPYNRPLYLVHITSVSTTNGPQARDFYALWEDAGKNGVWVRADGEGGTQAHYGELVAGPFRTPREVCQGAGNRPGATAQLPGPLPARCAVYRPAWIAPRRLN